MRNDVVLTDVPGKPGRFWGDHTTCVGPTRAPAWLVRCLGQRWASNLCGVVVALRLFARRGQCQGVVTEAGASGITFAWLQVLFPHGRKPHVMIDCNWYLTGSRWRDWFKGLRLRVAARSTTCFAVWASHEVEDYARAFGLPREKLKYVPFHHTLYGYTYEVRDDGYVFAGGNYDRDYPLLIEAVRPLRAPVWIATTRPEQLAGVTVPPHVRVEGTSAAGFRQAMAAAHIVVVPMVGGLLHSGGQQTLLNAMSLGKPTVSVGRKWAVDFVEDGVNGLIVDYGDVEGLRRAIAWLLSHPDEARQMAERGRQLADRHHTQRTMQDIYELVTNTGETRPRRVDLQLELPDAAYTAHPRGALAYLQQQERKHDVHTNGHVA
jgi:glycosyltransferase involved in cell wall biosynthesis